MAPKHGLGRGLNALFGDADLETEATISDENTAKEIPISKIFPNENQPRKVFDEASMLELVNSIRLHGVISPIILVRKGDGYMIIAGERRWRASKKAGLQTIPAIIREYSEKQIKEISLIENLQREDLNPIEVAHAIRQLMDDYAYTQEEVADRIGKSRPAIANTLRLLTLAPDVIALVAKGELSEGHARCLVSIIDEEQQFALAKQASRGKMTVRALEKAVRELLEPQKQKVKPPVQSLELRDMVERLQRVFATKVTIFGNDRKGRIYIDYFSSDDLNRIHALMRQLEQNQQM